MNSIASKVAFITGAGSGIGRAACQNLARHGVKIVATDQHVSTAEQTVALLEGSGHLALELDVTRPASINAALEKSLKSFPQAPNIVINSAGITRDNFILNLHIDEFDVVQNVNLRGTFLVMQASAKKLIEGGNSQGASFVNISSIIGKTGNLGQCNYAASKAGVVAMTKSASMEFGKFGIRVNAVLPGFIKTPMTETIPDKVKEIFTNRIPFRRLGTPEEVAQVIGFLALDESSYVNGTTIEVTGGMH